MALAALCGDDEWGQTWSRVAQHRFRSAGDLHDHAVGNLLIVALWELLGDSVAGLDWVARLLGAHGRVLPMSLVPLDIEAVMAVDEPVDRCRGGRLGHGPHDRPRPGGGGHRRPARGRARRPGAGPAAGLPRGGGCRARAPTGWCSAPGPGSPASSRTCSCPSSPTPCARPTARRARRAQPRAAAGRDRGLRAGDPPRGARPSTRRTCGWTPSLADTRGRAGPGPAARRGRRARCRPASRRPGRAPAQTDRHDPDRLGRRLRRPLPAHRRATRTHRPAPTGFSTDRM